MTGRTGDRPRPMAGGMDRLPLYHDRGRLWLCRSIGTARAAPAHGGEAPRRAGERLVQAGCVKRAEEYFYQALEASRLVDDLEGMVRAHSNLAVVAMAQGYYDEASAHLNRAWELNDQAKSTEEGP